MRWMVSVCKSVHVKASTKGTYGVNQRIFLRYCEAGGIDPLLVTEDQLCEAVCHFALGHTVNSVMPYLSALQNLFDREGMGRLPRGPSLGLTLRGLQRLFGPADVVVRSRAISLEDVQRLVVAADVGSPDEVCFVTQVLVAFFLCLRTDDHCNGRLRWGDVYPQLDGGVSFWLPPGKRTPHYRLVSAVARPDELDLLLWLRRLAGFVPQGFRQPDSPVFVSFAATAAGARGFWSVSRNCFVGRLKAVVWSVLGVDPELFAGHSIRRGGVTALLSANVPLPVVNGHVGWAPRSTMAGVYYDHSAAAQQRIATAMLLP
jgi:hypothetical protein